MIELNFVVFGVVICKYKNISLRGNYSLVILVCFEKNINYCRCFIVFSCFFGKVVVNIG